MEMKVAAEVVAEGVVVEGEEEKDVEEVEDMEEEYGVNTNHIPSLDHIV
eukprot:CAMPEP_0197827610 /NCGR_PEP_ID=MMETSP1437-20131217/4359_1 /TAXON_ID=49252 ORGANISM="Eucampia antarctica, Strain CCMP1452" /NCGR_SAMPLE_ID=MMETSP1437 /ASSEMBLY_ACC=CAM_ASM_001096 /LENGTH=48 /DNA_ID= /DNA_START= /DNA_END= /DNA_ORIENTATION=